MSTRNATSRPHKGRSGSAQKRKFLADIRRYRTHELTLRKQIVEFYTSLDSAVALSCAILYRYGEYEQLVKKDIDPRFYADYRSFRDDFAAVSFLRKNQFLNTGIDLRRAALDKFEAAEKQCKETNSRFSHLVSDPLFRGPNVWLLNAVTCKIAKWLEPTTKSWFAELLDSGSFGPGVSYHIRGENTSAERKFEEERGITQYLYSVFWKRANRLYPLWGLSDKQPILQNASRVDTVKKNAKEDRTIAIEPGINIWFQKGLGKMIRRRLLRAGFDLNSDLKNQRQAYKGSVDDKTATIDMKAASDTISKRMVEEILPHDWYTALNATRSHSFVLDGERRVFEKFSSMGNGFTFELESMIFVASALACCEYLGLETDSVSVFGDDITLPSGAASLYADFCNFLGFTVNTEKSFSSGPFRESCGSYYFNGHDVKPLFLKEYPGNVERVYNFANSIRHLAHRRTYSTGCDARFRRLHTMIVSSLPKALRLYGDVVGGQGCIQSNFDECCPRKLGHCLEGFSFKALTRIPVSVQQDSHGLLVARVRQIGGETSYKNDVTLRRQTRLGLNDLVVTQWYNFGPWL